MSMHLDLSKSCPAVITIEVSTDCITCSNDFEYMDYLNNGSFWANFGMHYDNDDDDDSSDSSGTVTPIDYSNYLSDSSSEEDFEDLDLVFSSEKNEENENILSNKKDEDDNLCINI